MSLRNQEKNVLSSIDKSSENDLFITKTKKAKQEIDRSKKYTAESIVEKFLSEGRLTNETDWDDL